MRAWRKWLAAGLSLLALTIAARAADQLAVEVINESEPTLCAEKDNVYLKLQSQETRRFTVEAVHPAYAGTIVVDRFAPDFTNCDMSNDPVFKSQRRQVTIYESAEWRLVGHTFDSFWRPNQVPVKVGNRVENGLHLLQLWTSRHGGFDEVLVLYPADGYWRARPMPPANLHWSAYGSSFLIGPVETQGRPLVDIRDVAYEPETKTFTLNFVRGGSATLHVERLDGERMVLDVNLSQSAGAQRPFAALRSMFVSEGNSDVARVGWRAKDSQRWLQEPVMEFKRANAAELWTGRLVPSRHNMSAPDIVFRDFSAIAK
jgi:membrane-bound inhibitor of C-type lysozyme